jgi:hypothetical protein
MPSESDLNTILQEIKTLSTKMDFGFAEVKSEMRNVEKGLNDKCVKLKEEICEVKNYVDCRFTSLQKSYELTLTGIPKGKYNLKALFSKLCTLLGYNNDSQESHNNIKTSVHCNSGPPEVELFVIPGDNSPIIIRFSTILQKEWFMKRYYANIKNMVLSKLGINIVKDPRFYIQQNLSTDQYKIFKFAKQCKSLKILHKIRITDFGKVAIQLQEKSDFLYVKDVNELKKITSAAQSSSVKSK